MSAAAAGSCRGEPRGVEQAQVAGPDACHACQLRVEARPEDAPRLAPNRPREDSR